MLTYEFLLHCENSRVLRLVPDDFRRYLKVVPGLRDTLERHCRERLIATLRKFQIPFFLGMAEERWKHLAHLCQLESHMEGEVLVAEGSPGDGG